MPCSAAGLIGEIRPEGPPELVPGSGRACNSQGLVAACSKRDVKHTQGTLWGAKWGI